MEKLDKIKAEVLAEYRNDIESEDYNKGISDEEILMLFEPSINISEEVKRAEQIMISALTHTDNLHIAQFINHGKMRNTLLDIIWNKYLDTEKYDVSNNFVFRKSI